MGICLQDVWVGGCLLYYKYVLWFCPFRNQGILGFVWSMGISVLAVLDHTYQKNIVIMMITAAEFPDTQWE